MDLKMLTRSEVAELLGATEKTLDMLREAQVLKPIKIGKYYMYSQFEIEDFERSYAGQYLSNIDEAIVAKAKVERARNVVDS